MRTLFITCLIILSTLSIKGQKIPFDGNGLFELIGLSVESKPMQKLKQFMREDPATKFSESVWLSRKKGLELGLKYGKVVRIFVHGKSPYNYGTMPFVGESPLGITHMDTESAVLGKLGKPDEQKSWGALLYYVKHKDHVYYTSFELNADKQSVKYIFIKSDLGNHKSSINAKDFGGEGIAVAEESSKIEIPVDESVTKKLGCVKGDCVDGIGTYVLKSGGKYIGEFKKGKRNGFGTLYYDNGDVFIGDWVQNQQEGNGVYEYATQGSYKLYAGEWRSGRRTGFGFMLYKNGTQRIGNWKSGVFEKIETKGCVAGDCKSNQSEYIWSDDGSRFVGSYKDGKRNGLGVYYYALGGKYQGEFMNGKREGKGAYYFPNGSKYVGAWKNDKREGYGILYKKGGIVVKGTWKNGQLISKN